MALFDGNKKIQGSRSNTALVKSGHNSPAEQWILDARFRSPEMSGVFKDGVLFNYQYGGPGMQDIVIPKGRAVGVSKPTKDFVSKKYVTNITLPGMATNSNVVGIAPYNFAKDWFQLDHFGGNQPSIITTEYIELPLMPEFTPSTHYTVQGVLEEEMEISVGNRMPWGAVIGNVQEGDYVKSTPSGRLMKWDRASDNVCDIVGQVLALDLNAEPWGWLKWMLTEEQYRKDDDAFINRSGVSGLPTDGGYPYDPSYAEGNTLFQNYQSQLVTNPTGIVGLHDGRGNYDGFGKNDTEYKDIEIGTIVDGTEADVKLKFQCRDFAGGAIKNIQQGVTVKIGDSLVDASKLAIDYEKGVITITVPETISGGDKTVTATYKAMHYGTPAYTDFKGVHGSVFILLKR